MEKGRWWPDRLSLPLSSAAPAGCHHVRLGFPVTAASSHVALLRPLRLLRILCKRITVPAVRWHRGLRVVVIPQLPRCVAGPLSGWRTRACS